MRRRELLKGGLAGAAAIAAPQIGRAERPNKLVFVPTSDLSLLDPVATGFRPTRNHAYLVFDTLYGIDTSWTAQPQMVEGHQVEEDGLIWTLTLRQGLRFHDKEPVLARDVVASIRRFAARISFAYALMSATEELSVLDDRTVRFRLKRPFPHLPEALAGPGGNGLAHSSYFNGLGAKGRYNPTFNHFCYRAKENPVSLRGSSSPSTRRPRITRRRSPHRSPDWPARSRSPPGPISSDPAASGSARGSRPAASISPARLPGRL
jgi:ABC-type transport system substrate-binding protein